MPPLAGKSFDEAGTWRSAGRPPVAGFLLLNLAAIVIPPCIPFKRMMMLPDQTMSYGTYEAYHPVP